MYKKSEDIERDVDELISKLTGKSAPSATPDAAKETQHYQLPVKHTRGGADIDEENEPWVVGTFIPGRYVSPTHPQGHNGIDLKAPKGSPIYPIAPGEVVETRVYPNGGNTLKVSHEDGGVVSYYAHLDSVSVSVGQPVDFDTVLGAMGDTGNAKGRGAHLHYEVQVNGRKVDPSKLSGKVIGSLSKKAAIILDTINRLNKLSSDNRIDQFKDILSQLPNRTSL